MSTQVVQRQDMASSSAELTPEQIDDLLGEATVRLRAKNDTIARQTFKIPTLNSGENEHLTITRSGKQMNGKKHEQPGEEVGIRRVADPIAARAIAAEKRKATAGAMWFDLPKTDLTPQLKRDLQLIKMRGVLDPHRHYKKDNGKMKAPEYSMVGTIKEGAAEFYSGRISNKERKQTFVEQVLSGEKETGRFNSKYNDLQSKRKSGGKEFYKKLQAKRFRGVKKGG